jgi:hypothetical protein
MDQIEIRRLLKYLFHHCNMMGYRILTMGIQPQRPGAYRHQPCVSDGITAGKQRDIVPKTHQLLGEPGYYALGTSI